jgi:hypothetical protein
MEPQQFAAVDERTTWLNPTSQKMTLRLSGEASTSPRKARPVMHVVEVPPGQKVVLPKEYDEAIHQRDQYGTIIGGIAPHMVNMADPDRKLVAELDPSVVSEMEARQMGSNFVETVKTMSKMVGTLATVGKAVGVMPEGADGSPDPKAQTPQKK